MNTEQQKETNRIIVCGVLGIIAMVYLALIGCVNVQHFNYKMNSDIGAEAVLARLTVSYTHLTLPTTVLV